MDCMAAMACENAAAAEGVRVVVGTDEEGVEGGLRLAAAAAAAAAADRDGVPLEVKGDWRSCSTRLGAGLRGR